MAVLAHAADWLTSSIYLAPMLIIWAVLGVAKVRDRRAGGDSERTPIEPQEPG